MSAKEELKAALRGAGVYVSPSATVSQLRTLLASVVGSSSSVNPASNHIPDEHDNQNSSNPFTDKPMNSGPPWEKAVNESVELPEVPRNENNLNAASDNAPQVSEIEQNLNASCCNPPEVPENIHNLNAPRGNLPEVLENVHNLNAPINEDAELDQELERLDKRRRIAQMRAELAAMENTVLNVQSYVRRLEFTDIQHAIAPFSGDNTYGIRKWLIDFNNIMDASFADNRIRLLFARRLMTGSAAIFLRNVTADTWDILQQQLVREFGRQINRRDIYLQLASRSIRRDETTRQYVLTMQDLARQGDIGEQELVQIIVDGLNDHSAAVTMLYQANSIDNLKDLLVVYERYRNRSVSRTVVQPASSIKPSLPIRPVNSNLPVQPRPIPPNSTESPRCFNCRQFGHTANLCFRPKRPINGCFHCFEEGHRYQDCPKRRRPAVIAAVEEPKVTEQESPSNADDEISEELAALQWVSVAFNVTEVGQITKSKLFSLFDTGSPANFIRKAHVPSKLCSNILIFSGCKGIGDARIYTYGKVQMLIEFQKQSHVITAFIVPDNILPTSLLLGRDFLKTFNIGLSFLASTPKLKLNELDLCKDSCTLDGTLNFVYSSFFCESDFGNRSLSQRLDVDLRPLRMSASLVVSDGVFDIYPEISCVDDFDIGVDFGLSVGKSCRDIINRAYLKAIPSSPKPCNQFLTIRLTSDIPFYCSPRRLSHSDRIETDRIINDLLKQGVIRPSDSPYASPIVLVKKKNGEYRMCVDYRALNKLTVRDNFPLPLIDHCLEYLDGKTCFSLLDLKNGFHQVRVSPESVKYTAFVTPRGQYEYVQMPFGLKNGPSVFQRFITVILRDMIEASEIVVYMDDILLATCDPHSHLILLEKLLFKLKQNGLELKFSKCHFMQTSIDYLGYAADRNGIRPNDSHIRAIRDYPIPSNARELQSCLGLFSYFRRFVPSFSRIAIPLLNLLRKATPSFQFDADCERSFFILRDALIAAPVLAIYNCDRETEIHTDASSHGFGAVLLQKQADNKFHPVSYYSRRTNATESRYHSFELETLAVIMALRRFGPLIGFKKPFKIITDCSALTLTLAKKDINPKISRWVFEIEQYNYTIMHRKGVNMGHVDALSRNHVIANLTVEETDVHLRATQARDPVIADLCKRMEKETVAKFSLSNGLVYRQMPSGRSSLYVPSEMESNVIRLIHEKIGHLGVDKCYDQIRIHYWFPAMHRKIETFIKNCIRCVMHTAPTRLNERHLHSIPKEPVPFDTIHIDHFGPLCSVQNKNKHILVVIDAFTKFVKLYPANTTSTKEVCSALTKYFDSYSRPHRIISDRGTCFTSLEFAQFLLENNVTHIKNAVASPQANGQAERVNRVITAMLGKMTNPVNQSDWTRLLARAEYAINNSVHSSTRQSPSMLLFGVSQRGPEVDFLTEYLEEIQSSAITRDLSSLRQNASAHIQKSQTRNEQQYIKRSVPPQHYMEGDFVVIRNVDTTTGKNKKLIPKYRGPYRVHRVLPNDRYIIRDIETCQMTQIPYNGVLEAARLKPWVKAQTDIIAACYGNEATLYDRGRSTGQKGRM